MGIKYLLVIVIVSLIASCRSSTHNTVINQTHSQNISKLKVIIVRAVNEGTNDSVGNTINGIGVNVLVVNTSEDTVKLAYSDCLASTFFTTNNSNLILTDLNFYCKSRNVEMTILKPHQYLWAKFFFTYRKAPNKVTEFKIGFRMLSWDNYNKETSQDIVGNKHADFLWSDNEIFNPNGNQSSNTKPTRDYKKLAEILFPPLNSLQQKRQILSIDKDHIVRRETQICSGKDEISFVVPLKLSNNSNDTLEYTNMSCDWPIIFITNNHLINIPSECTCLSNFPINYRIAPHKDITFNIPVDFDAAVKPGTHFRLGIVLLDFKNMVHDMDLDFLEYLSVLTRDPKYTIWSDEIEVPLSK